MSKFIYAIIPIAHESLSREQVAERLLKAAKRGGYKMDKDPLFAEMQKDDTHFIVDEDAINSSFIIYSGGRGPQHLTLEEFEQHCQELAEAREANEHPEPTQIEQMRFDAAKAAMQGIISNDTSARWNWQKIAELSVEAADQLISELQKPKP